MKLKPASTPSSPPMKKIKKSADFFMASSGFSTVDSDLRQQMIATAAYYRAERRGFNGGDPSIDWYEAEMEVDQILRGSAPDDRNMAQLEALLVEWDARFEELKNKIVKAKAQTRTEYQKQLHAIADKRSVISDKLEDLRQHTGEAWNDLKNTIEHAWDEMCQETERLTSRFKHEETPGAGKKKKEAQ
ncbi:MAG: DUF2934 domain-containing protein [Pseudomonadota bacterium]